MTRTVAGAACVVGMTFVLGAATPVSAQPAGGAFEAGAQVVSVRVSEFDRADVGFGGRIAWRPLAPIGIESEFNWFPGEFPGLAPFSRSRVEGLFGATVGPTLGRVRPFGRLRAGFLSMAEAPEPYACIAIYPPPLSCALAGGRTLAAFDLGGGVELAATDRTFVRIDLGDRIVKYPGPVFDRRSRRRDGSFASHDFRLSAGVGIRF
jgi:hypothetical protein